MQRSIIAPAERVTNLRWGIAVLLGIGVLINYFDRVNLTVAGPSLRKEFGIDDVQFGYLLSAFAWTYAVLQIPVGVFLDRYGVVLIGRVTTLLWSIASGLTALATGFGTIFASRLLLGVAETPTFPINSKATATGSRSRNAGSPPRSSTLRRNSRPGSASRWCRVILSSGWRMTFVVTAS